MIYLVTRQTQLFESSSYTLISKEESLEMMQSWERIQVDSETTGRDAHINKMLCVQFGNKKAGCQIVVDTTTIDILEYKELLESKPLIGQNLKFDLQFFYSVGIVPLIVYDTMIVEQLIYLGYPSGSIRYSLHEIAFRYLGINIDKTVRGEIIWRGLDTSVIVYAAGDVTYLEDIMEKQIDMCRERGVVAGAILENRFVPVIAYLEWCGIRLDIDKWTAKMAKNQEDLENRRKELDALAISWGNPKYFTVNRQGDLFEGFDTEPKCTINWSSSSQVVSVAKYLGFNTNIQDKKTGEDKDSVVEKQLKGQKGINDEFLKKYFAYQEASKVCSTYGQTYIDAINPNTGRIHTVFRQLGASSGRMACGSGKQKNTDLAKLKAISPSLCTYVQLQNLPADNETRSSFIPNEGNIMCSSDYSALEARLGADIYNEKAMLHEFLHGSGDMHSLCAKMVFKEELKDVEVKDVAELFPKLRKDVKPVEFAKQFGGSEYSIADTLGCSIEEARKFSKAYDEGFTGVTEFKNKGSKEVRSKGYVLICAATGHKMYWHDWDEWVKRQRSFNSEFWDRYRVLKQEDPNHPMVQEVKMHFKAASKWDRLALNAVTQGTGIIILKAAMTEFFHWIVANGHFNKVLICNLVHDEAVIEYPEGMPNVDKILVEKMEEAAAKYCKRLPIPAVAEVGKKWIH